MAAALWLAVALVIQAPSPPAGAPAPPAAAVSAGREIIATIQVHGNVLTSEEEIRRIAGVAAGAPFEADSVATITARLEADRRFQRIEVLKRFASITDPSQVTIVIVVDEGPVKIARSRERGAPARVVRGGGARLLFLPVLKYEEGYGFSYGVHVARPDPVGARSRLSFPLTWGGERRAGVQLERNLARGPLRQVEIGGALSRRTHPFYDAHDARRRVWGRAGLRLVGPLRADATAAWEQVTFGGRSDRVGRVGAGVTIDTRIDPVLARNAVFLRAGWEQLASRGAGGIHTTELDLRGYLGLLRQVTLEIRALRQDPNRSLPDYLKPMLGGGQTLRGFPVGSAVGDTLTAGSIELRMPVTSPLRVGKLGVSVFADAGTVYDEGGRLGDQRFERGVGTGVWFSAAFFRFNLAVARGIGHGMRVHVGTNLMF